MGDVADLGSLTDCYVTQPNGKRALAVNSGGAPLETVWTDPTNTPIELLLHNDDSEITITQAMAAGDQVINVQAGHGFTVGDFLFLSWTSALLGRSRAMQAEVIISAAEQITIGIPIFENIALTDIILSTRNNVNMAVSGSLASPKEFHVVPPPGIQWDLTRIILTMQLTGQPDDSRFGNIARLTNGMYFGIKQPGAVIGYLGGFHDNSDFRATAYDLTYASRTLPAGSWGLAMRKTFAGPDKYGVAIRLDGDAHREFVAVVQDDLTTGSPDIIQLRATIMGHIVDY